MLIIGMAVQSRTLSQLPLRGHDEHTGMYDIVCSLLAGGVWLLIHVYYIKKAVRNFLRGGKQRDENLQNGGVGKRVILDARQKDRSISETEKRSRVQLTVQ